MIRLFAIIQFIVLFSSSNILSQVLPFRSYRVRDGLVSNSITSMCQDKEGYMWIGTSDGVSVFDGINIRNFTIRNGLSYGYVNALLDSKQADGGMWIAMNSNGVNRYRNGSFTSFRFGHNEKSNRVNALMQDVRGDMWCGTDEGLFCIHQDRVEEFSVPSQCNTIHRLVELDDSTFWMISQTGLYSYSLKSKRVTFIESVILRFSEISYLYKDNERNIWLINSDNSLVQFRDGKSVQRIQFSTNITFIHEDNNRHYWIGSQSGLYYSLSQPSIEKNLIFYSSMNGVPNPSFNSCSADREGNIWFGSSDGVAVLQRERTYTFPELKGSGRAVCDTHGHVWVASEYGLWEFWDTHHTADWKKFLHPIKSNWSHGKPVDIKIDTQNNLWMSVDEGGLTKFHLAGREQESTDLHWIANYFSRKNSEKIIPFQFAIDTCNNIWCILNGHTVIVCDAMHSMRVIKRFTISDGLPENLRLIYCGHDNHIWVSGFEKGIAEIIRDEFGNWIVNRKTDSIIGTNVAVRSMFQSSNNAMWFGTRRAGVYEYSTNSTHSYTINNGLLNDQVWSITESKDGTMWFGTELGICHRTTSPRSSFRLDQSLTDNPVYSCGVRDDGIIWFMAANVLTLYNYIGYVHDTTPPDIRITHFHVNEQNKDVRLSHSFSPNENNCLFEFICVRFRDAREIQYQYMLEGVDTNWRTPTHERSVSFAALKPGSYRFLVRAISGEGIVSTVPAKIQFSISQPFWFRWWFLLLLLSISGSITFVLVRVRVRRLVEIERIRARIAADLHDDIGSGLTRIAILSDVMQKQLQHSPLPPETKNIELDQSLRNPSIRDSLGKVGIISRELVEAMTDVVWSIDPRNDSLDKLLHRVRVFANEMCDAKDIHLTFTVPEGELRMKSGSDIARSILLVVKEALNNIVRHSACTEAKILFMLNNGSLVFDIIDNGIGFDPDLLSRINGLVNMRSRIAKANGTFELHSAIGSGTTIHVVIPLET